MATTTLRKELTEEGLDWDTPFTLIVQRFREPLEQGKSYYGAVLCDGQWFTTEWCYADSDLLTNVIIAQGHPLLDLEFDTGYGRPNMPRFWCKSPAHIYFPGTYDGATWVTKVALYPGAYLDPDAEDLPYVGG